MAYSGLAQKFGFNQATAVYYSGTYTDRANAPCNLVISSADGGSIFIKDTTGAVIYQQPAPPPPRSLYAFEGITFSSCTNLGRLGPTLTQCTSSYAPYGAWTSNTSFFSVARGIQRWTVPATGVYSLSALVPLLSSLCVVTSHICTCPGAAATQPVSGQLPS